MLVDHVPHRHRLKHPRRRSGPRNRRQRRASPTARRMSLRSGTRRLDMLQHVAAKNEIERPVELVGAEIFRHDLDAWPLRVGRLLAGHATGSKPVAVLAPCFTSRSSMWPSPQPISTTSLPTRPWRADQPGGQLLGEGLEFRREVQRVLVAGRIDHALRIEGAVPDQRAGPADHQIHVARGRGLRRCRVRPELIADDRHVAERERPLLNARFRRRADKPTTLTPPPVRG